MNKQNQNTHFGFRNVAWNEKEKMVGEVFHSVADKYDIMNDLMSLGIHRLWKHYTIEISQIRAGHRVLDLACGSGDLSKLICKKVGLEGCVYLTDINSSMLAIGRNKLIDSGYMKNTRFIQANAEKLPFQDNFFNCVTIAFGLRNVTDKLQALKSIYKVLSPGGKIIVLEFSSPNMPGLKQLYDWYSFNLLPKVGELVVKDKESYQYLAESIRMHPNQENLKSIIEEAGFEDCSYQNLTFGIVALHIAYKY